MGEACFYAHPEQSQVDRLNKARAEAKAKAKAKAKAEPKAKADAKAKAKALAKALPRTSSPIVTRLFMGSDGLPRRLPIGSTGLCLQPASQ